ncbi:OmpP1/FadL family transporter [Mangrovimonas cancribranchiae]|uniref:Long-chain fatty acid transport protein n=1 Tax=Mangrovimonas cancribranchiae TaxID=3080055 RepID=A0AAU6P2E2_9FLAO
MIKKLLIVFLALIAFTSYAQEDAASPYSFYGIGSLKFKGTVENQSMGGLSIFSDSIHVNLRNPASYAGKNLEIYGNKSRPVKFTVGGSHSTAKLKSNSGEDRYNSSTFDYIALSIPMNKFGFGFGLLPYTSVGYKLETYGANGIETRFRGEGGVNKAFLSLGYQITDNLSAGIDVNYNFGNIQNKTLAFSYNSDDELTRYQTREDNRSDLSGFNINLGVIYKRKITDKLELTSAATYTPKTKLNSRNQRYFNTIAYNTSLQQEFIVNTIEANLDANGLKETELVMPAKLSVGAGIGQPRKWFVGAEYTFQKTSDFSNELYNASQSAVATNYKNASNFSLGGFFIPEYNSFSSYLKRVVYRAGVRFGNTGLSINNEDINEFGISFGLGLPVGNAFSNANLGIEVGEKGTINNNLIQENFVNINLSLSLNDRWFVKRKYN